MTDKEQKTEQPTPRRIEKARREGQFSSSREFGGALQFLAFVGVVAFWGPGWIESLRGAAHFTLRKNFGAELEIFEVTTLFRQVAWRLFLPLLAAGGGLVAVALGAQLAMTKFGVSAKRLAPDFKRLNPIARLRDLVRQNGWNLAKALLMLPLFGVAVWMIVRDNLPAYLILPLVGVEQGARHAAGSIVELLWQAAGAFLVVGLLDLARQRRRYRKDLRMSKREVREEIKEVEGNPHVRMRIRRLQRDLLRRRMMQEVKTATAVVVNPSHFAVAIRYRPESMGAPVVVAKGKNYLARRIRALAEEHKVPLIENPPLAQALYKAAAVGQEIPAHLYRAVAEVLAYVYRLMGGRFAG